MHAILLRYHSDFASDLSEVAADSHYYKWIQLQPQNA